MTSAAIIPAAGRGERLGPGKPKALRALGGAPLLVHAVRTLVASRAVESVVVAADPERAPEVERLLADYEWALDIGVVPGGDCRRASVAAALATLPDWVELIVVHDAARPLAPPELVQAVLARLRSGADACIPVLPLVDTVKEVAGELVTRTLDRTALRAVQTPQGFRRETLARAHAWAAEVSDGELGTVTDDAGLVERLGIEIATVTGAEEAFKVTRPLDLLLAEAVLARRRADGAC